MGQGFRGCGRKNGLDAVTRNGVSGSTVKSLETIDLACDCCGAHDERFILEKAGALTGHSFRLVKCRNCGFLYFNPRPTESAISILYDSQYYSGRGFDPGVDYVQDFENPNDEAKRFRPGAHARRLLAFKSPPARLLDFGCGIGDFARQARRLGYDVEGFEISPDAREFCSHHGLKVYSEQLPTAQYDIVTAIEVIEHAYSPTRMLSQIHSALKPGGYFLYTTRNMRPFEILNRMGMASDHPYLKPEGHLNFFTRETMKRFLAKTGFRKIGAPFSIPARSPKALLRHYLYYPLQLHLPCGIK